MEIIHQVNEHERIIIRIDDNDILHLTRQRWRMYDNTWEGEEWTGYYISINHDAIEPVIQAIQRLQKLFLLK